MPYVVVCSRPEHPAKMEEKLSQRDIANYTAKRHQLVCWQASISVNWAIGDVCKVFVCLLVSEHACFGTDLLIAALSVFLNVGPTLRKIPAGFMNAWKCVLKRQSVLDCSLPRMRNADS